MNILVITANHPPYHVGGYELRCKNVIDLLVKRGYRVIVATNIPLKINKKMDQDNVYRVLHPQRSKNLFRQVLWDIQDLQWISRLIHKQRIDVLYLWHTIELSRTLFPFIAELSLPVVYDEGVIGLIKAWKNHGAWINYCDRKRTTPAREWFKKIVCAIARLTSGSVLPTSWKWPEKMYLYFNSQVGLDATKQAGVPVKKASVIYSGLQLSDFPFKSPSSSFGRKIRVIVPGRIVRVKGIDLAIKVLASLKSVCPDKEFEMVIVGPATDMPYLKELHALVIRCELQDNLQFMDQVDHHEMASLYASAEFCLFPSMQKEGLSRVPLEAMACGSLILSAGNEGSQEIVNNGINGVICSYDDPVRVASVIVDLLDNPPLFQKIMATARKIVEERYTIEHAVDQIETVLKAALSENHS